MLTRVEPVYPDAGAPRAGIEGTVELEVSIDATGKVTDVEVVRGLPLGPVGRRGRRGAALDVPTGAHGPGPVASRKTVRMRFVAHAPRTEPRRRARGL